MKKDIVAYRKTNGQIIDNVGDYVLNWVAEFPDCEIHIGTDSQVKGKITTFYTAICMREFGKGVHVIGRTESISNVKYDADKRRPKSRKLDKGELFKRLFSEVQRSKDVADDLINYLLDNGVITNFSIHLDLNANEMYESNMVVSTGVGLIKGSGYDVKIKPFAWAASKAADNFCRINT